MLKFEPGILKTGSWMGRNRKNGKIWEEWNILTFELLHFF